MSTETTTPAGDTVTLTVTINGTDTNPWRRMGLRQNPFPQSGIHELAAGERLLASLDGDPVRSTADIRERLKGCSSELVDLCVRQWRPGERVSFTITFPRGADTTVRERNLALPKGEPALVCDDCYTVVTGNLAECRDGCAQPLDHDGLCLSPGGPAVCMGCGRTARLHEVEAA